MDPKQRKTRQTYPGGRYVRTSRIDDNTEQSGDDIFSSLTDTNYDFNDYSSTYEEANIQINPNMTGDDENRRIEAIKRAIDIAKLMDNINMENLLKIAEDIDKYLVGQ